LLLAPAPDVPGLFRHVSVEPSFHDRYLAEMQRFRGSVYLEDAAIQPAELDSDGRQKLAADDRSWHLLTLDQDGRVSGCARYLPHPNHVGFEQLSLYQSALAANDKWSSSVRSAVEAEIGWARYVDLSYVEVGGWALAPKLRWTTAAVRIALAVFALSQALGGCIGISTATIRNSSSSILKRIGGRPLDDQGVELPPYYEPRYGCVMELLRFDSNMPSPRYREWVTQLYRLLLSVPVICPAPARCFNGSAPWTRLAERHAWRLAAS
jgi:hypothetical protein